MKSLKSYFSLVLVTFACSSMAWGALQCEAIFKNESAKRISKQHVQDQRDWNTRYYGPRDKAGVYPGAYVDLKFDYWIVDKDDPRLKTFGDISELKDKNGDIYLIGDMHFEVERQQWLKPKSSQILESIFGRKSGELTGHRHSSVRSATLELPNENRQIWVKLDGSYLNLYQVDKALTLQDILRSQEANQILKSSALYLQELGAVLVTNAAGETVPIVSRQNPLSVTMDLEPTDRLVTLHSLAANLNDYQPQSDYAGLARNESADRIWFKKIGHKKIVNSVIAAIADVIITSVFDFGVHLAPHGQNMEFVLRSDGSIKQYWQKDLQEAKVDVELAQHFGLASKNSEFLESFDIHNAESKIQKWYTDYLRADQQSILMGDDAFSNFNQKVKIALIERFKIWVEQNRSKYRIEKVNKDLKNLIESSLEPWQVVLELRKLVLEKSHP